MQRIAMTFCERDVEAVEEQNKEQAIAIFT